MVNEQTLASRSVATENGGLLSSLFRAMVVRIASEPGERFDVLLANAPFGKKSRTVVVFEDLYGNKWDLIQPKDIQNE